MNSSSSIAGVWTAIVTPFDDNGEIDWDAYLKLLDRQVEAGVEGIVVAGTTGESPTLTNQEKLALFRKTRANLPANIRMMAGTGGNNTNQSVELSKLAVDAGADSLLIVTPPYNKPTKRGLTEHFRAIKDAVSVPLCFYHVPGRTAQLLSPEVIADICNELKIESVKEASADIGLFSRLTTRTTANILSGDDPTFLSSLAVGGKGVVSVVSNVYPKLTVALWRLWNESRTQDALSIHNRLLPVIDALFCESNPAPTKLALNHMGLVKNNLRLPLCPVTEESKRLILDAIETAGSDETNG